MSLQGKKSSSKNKVSCRGNTLIIDSISNTNNIKDFIKDIIFKDFTCRFFSILVLLTVLSIGIHPVFAQGDLKLSVASEKIKDAEINYASEDSIPEKNDILIIDFFSDSEFSDAIVRFEKPFENVSLVFVLSLENKILKSETFSLNSVEKDQEITKIVFWGLGKDFKKGIDPKKNRDSYKVQLYVKDDNKTLASRETSFLYQNPVLSNFKVVDFSADSEKASILLTPVARTGFQDLNLPEPSMIDLDLKLFSGTEVVYSSKQENIPVTNTYYNATYWPFLLEKDGNYTALLKIHSHSPDFTTAYSSDFKAKEKVEILDHDVDVDEYGVSVTVVGRSQVPFDGIIRVVLTPENGKSQVFEETADILTAGREDTIGIIWQGVPKGDYNVKIYALNLEGEILDSYETVLRVFEPVSEATPVEDSPGFGFFAALGILLLPAILFQRKRKGKRNEEKKLLKHSKL